MSLLYLLVLPFLGAPLALLFSRMGARACWLASLVALLFGLFVLTALTAQWSAADPLVLSVAWMPDIGLYFSLWLDGPALFWAWLVLGIGFLVIFYAGFYMDPGDSPGRFYANMLLFLGSMLGLVIARNLLLMFIFWEMTSITSFLLIGHWHHKASAMAGARRALLVTALGGLALMTGIAVLYWMQLDMGLAPTLEWSELWALRPDLLSHAAAPWALVLMLLGVFTKSAQFPFHFWLPGAMEAPTPVSALLHAATMVKAGIYLLGRIYPIFNELTLWLVLVATIGAVTMIIGGYLANIARDIKQLLAFSTVSQLGLIVAYYGFGHQRTGGDHLLTLDLLLVANHALFKGALFMLCGVIDHSAHTRDWTRLGGLWRKMPVTFALTVIGCLSMAGGPFTLGFVAKKMFLEASFDVSGAVEITRFALISMAIIGSIFTMAYCLRLSILPFLGRPREAEPYKHAHEGSLGILASPLILLTVVVVGGLSVHLVTDPLSQLVRSEFYDPDAHYAIGFFKKADLMFWISMGIYFIGGPLFFLAAPHKERLHHRLGLPMPFLRFFDQSFDKWIPRGAAMLTRRIQSPSLRQNLAVTILALFGLTAVYLFRAGAPADSQFTFGWGEVAGGAFLLTITALCVMLIVVRNPLQRLLTLGFIGIIVAGYFALYKAPDLAITQVLVELVLLLMFLLLLRRVGWPTPAPTTRRAIVAAAAVAIFAGIVVGRLTFLGAAGPDRHEPILAGNPTHAEFYLTHSKYAPDKEAHSGGGSNVVNVILVDFRGLDTLGEITVLAIAALGIICLLSGRGQRQEQVKIFQDRDAIPRGAPEIPALAGGASLIFRTLGPMLILFAVVFAIYLFFAGHNAPGGGFIAGLLTSVALLPMLWGAQHDQDDRFPVIHHPTGAMPWGIIVAVFTGLGAVALGHAFLHSAFTYVYIPLVGEIEVASAALFDLGVMLVVIGSSLSILKSFGMRS